MYIFFLNLYSVPVCLKFAINCCFIIGNQKIYIIVQMFSLFEIYINCHLQTLIPSKSLRIVTGFALRSNLNNYIEK